MAGIAGQSEDHGVVVSECNICHNETLWRRGSPMQRAEGAPPCNPPLALVWEGAATDLDYVAFPGVETGKVTGQLNQVLCGAPPLAYVQDGFHIKVVRWGYLLEFWAIESPFYWFNLGICHHAGHKTGVSHSLHTKYLLGPVALVAFCELATGLAHPDVVIGCKFQRALAYHPPWTSHVCTVIPRLAPQWSSSWHKAPF